MTEHTADCLIIGAGMSGLMAGTLLNKTGLRVIILDMGRGVGGRMATRRVQNGVFDHGAQYFTVRDDRFRAFVDDWLAAGLLYQWSTGFYTADGILHDNGEKRYRGANGMTTIPKYLAQNLNVRTEHEVTRLDFENGVWTACTVGDNSAPFSARMLILTPPVPQSLELIDSGSVVLPADDRAALDQIDYDPCFAIMVLLDSPSNIPVPGGLWLDGEPISWISDNFQKDISPVAHAVTIHAGSQFTREHWDNNWDDIARILLQAAAQWIGDAKVIETSVQRWRYSQPIYLHPDRCLVIESPAPLVFAGDAFKGARVEGAALSGMAAADAILRLRKYHA